MPDKGENSCPLGIDAARGLCNMGHKGKLVFLTTSREYAEATAQLLQCWKGKHILLVDKGVECGIYPENIENIII